MSAADCCSGPSRNTVLPPSVPSSLHASSSIWIATASRCAMWSGRPTTAASSKAIFLRPSATASTCASRRPRTPTRAMSKPCIASKKTSSSTSKISEAAAIYLPRYTPISFTSTWCDPTPTRKIKVPGKSSSGLLLAHPSNSACFHPSSWITTSTTQGDTMSLGFPNEPKSASPSQTIPPAGASTTTVANPAAKMPGARLNKHDELRLLVNSRHPIITVETPEEERLEQLLFDIANELSVPFYTWSVTTGLAKMRGAPIYNSDNPEPGAGQSRAASGRCHLSSQGFCALLRQRSRLPAPARTRGEISRGAAIDCNHRGVVAAAAGSARGFGAISIGVAGRGGVASRRQERARGSQPRAADSHGAGRCGHRATGAEPGGAAARGSDAGATHVRSGAAARGCRLARCGAG